MEDQQNTNETDNHHQQNGLTALQEEAFVLTITGLMEKEVGCAMGKTENDVKGYLMRVAVYFKLDANTKSVKAAIGIATETGYKDKLFNKFRDKHRVHIERYENAREVARKKLATNPPQPPGDGEDVV